MSNYNRNPGGHRGPRPPNTFLGRSTYHEWKETGQLWPGSPTRLWATPFRGPRGTGPRVGMTEQQRLHWSPVQNYGIRSPPRILVPVSRHRSSWPIPTVSQGRGREVRPATTGVTSTNIYAMRDNHRHHPGMNSCGRESRGRRLWPDHSRNHIPHRSVSTSEISSVNITSRSIPSTDIFRASSDSGAQAGPNSSSSKKIVRRSFSNLVSVVSTQTDKIKQETPSEMEIDESDGNKRTETKTTASVIGMRIPSHKENLAEARGRGSYENDSVTTEIQSVTKLFQKSIKTKSLADQRDDKSLPLSAQLQDNLTLFERSKPVACVIEDIKTVKEVNSGDSVNSSSNTTCLESVERDGNNLAGTSMSHVSTELKTAEKPANVKDGTKRLPISVQRHEVCVKSDTTSPHKLKAASRSRPKETQQFSQKESESGYKRMKSNEEPTKYQSDEDVVIVVFEPNQIHKFSEAQKKVPGKQKQETLMEVTNSSDTQTSEVTGTKDVCDHTESSKPKSKFSQATLSSKKIVNQGNTLPPCSSGTTSTRTSCSTSNYQQISEGLENLRKMFKSTSFTMPGVRTPGKSDTSVKITNSGSGKEKQTAFRTEVKVDAGSHQGAVKGVTNISDRMAREADRTSTQEIEDNTQNKSITPSEIEEMERSQDDDANLGHSEHDGEVDNGDNALPFMETSSIGNNELFGSDPLLLCDDSSQATIEYYSEDDADLPDEDHIEMAMGKIFRYQDEYKDPNSNLPAGTSSPAPEDESDSRGSRRRDSKSLERKHESSKHHSRKLPKTTISLDKLLAEHKTTAEELETIKNMEEKLRIGLKSGGVNRFINEETDDEADLLPEHQDQLKHYTIKEGGIPEEHPGEPVFDDSRFGQIYSLPDHCKLEEDFNFIPSSSSIDLLLVNTSQDMMGELLQDDIVLTCINRISNPHLVLNWLFHLMSIHTSSLTSKCIQDLLYHILHMKRGPTNVKSWAPTFREAFKLFLNYGANTDSLFVILEVADEVSEIEPHVLNQVEDRNGAPHVHNNGPRQDQSTFRLENLKFVLRVLTWALQQRPNLYDKRTLKYYTLLTCRVALAEHLTQGYHTYEFEALISAQLDTVPDSDWGPTETWLCSYLPNITEFHHNKVYLTELMPHTERGLHLKRRLSFCMLQQLIKNGETARSPENFVVQHLYPLVSRLRISPNTDYYELWSIVSLIDTCVGNETLCQTDMEDLKLLMEKLGKLKSRIKDIINHDGTVVKDKMVWLDSKWKFRVQNRSYNQQSMFAYASYQTSGMVKEVNVVSIQDDDETDGDDIDPGFVDIKGEEMTDSESESEDIKLEIKEK